MQQTPLSPRAARILTIVVILIIALTLYIVYKYPTSDW